MDPWAGAAQPFELTRLRPGTPYPITVTGRSGSGADARSVTESITTLVSTAPAPGLSPTSPATPAPSTPATGGGSGAGARGFKPFTIGASVTGAANGDFNRWTGTKHGLYATWADNGKVWAIDDAGKEYGSGTLSRLGDYDLDIATQHKLAGGWANPGIDAALEKTFREIKDRWGARKGTVYVRPFHEFNGNWYQWSVRNSTDQANFVRYWQNVVAPLFRRVFGTDARFKLVWSPNRDSSTSLDVRKSFPGKAFVDAIGIDYYDFSRANDEAKWAAEATRTQNGGPVGLIAWADFAAAQGVPWYLPEYGVQFGDNDFFLGKVLDVIEERRYTGVGDPAGKCLGAAWHNLQGKSPDPNAGGDFFVQRGGQDYSGRRRCAVLLRTWVKSKAWIRQPA
ncbi:glycosyl hydrolase [Kineococcus terrestris]|uniref:glycosyl hydrolase n=1 Tax=Kineococcus terrestris TaxID=2044856 RepID=UPI0034DB7145